MISEYPVKIMDEEFHQRKNMEAGRKGKNNTDNFNGTGAGGLQQVRQPATTTTQIHHVQGLDQGEDKWQTQKTKLTKQQEQVPKNGWNVRGMQQQENVQDDQQLVKTGMNINVPISNNFIALDIQKHGTKDGHEAQQIHDIGHAGHAQINIGKIHKVAPGMAHKFQPPHPLIM